MKKVVVIFVLSLIIYSCSKVPVTGRRQLHMLPESTLMGMSLTSYRQFLSENKIVTSSEVNAAMVKKVGQKIAAAVELYLRQKKQTKRVKNFKWEFNLVHDPTVNAWCMPGGKVVVYTGLLPVTQTEAGLAVVMGHEIAHAIARHGNERMSQGLIVQAGGIGLSVAMSQKPQLTQNIFNQAYGLGSTLGTLGYSRKHESEADKIGLIFSAMAGYDPNEAIPFWQRMSKMGGGGAPQLLSTHPSDETRIKDLKAFMPQAMKYYKKP
ncbi:MAG: M48 family metallopeptidase [Bacteroidota bacterium]